MDNERWNAGVFGLAFGILSMAVPIVLIYQGAADENAAAIEVASMVGPVFLISVGAYLLGAAKRGN